MDGRAGDNQLGLDIPIFSTFLLIEASSARQRKMMFDFVMASLIEEATVEWPILEQSSGVLRGAIEYLQFPTIGTTR